MNGENGISDKLLRETLFRDISDCSIELEASEQLVAKSYLDFTEGRETVKSVRRLLAQTEDRSRRATTTFAMYGASPNSHCMELLGTIRTRMPKHDCIADRMESFELMQFPAGWSRFVFSAFDPSNVIEFSRLAVTNTIRRGIAYRLKFHHVVVQSLFKRAYLTTLAMGSCSAGWAIVPSKIRHILDKSCDARCEIAPGVELNEQRHQSLFERFSGYWYQQDPKLCRINFTQLACDPVVRFWNGRSQETISSAPTVRKYISGVPLTV